MWILVELCFGCIQVTDEKESFYFDTNIFGHSQFSIAVKGIDMIYAELVDECSKSTESCMVFMITSMYYVFSCIFSNGKQKTKNFNHKNRMQSKKITK